MFDRVCQSFYTPTADQYLPAGYIEAGDTANTVRGHGWVCSSVRAEADGGDIGRRSLVQQFTNRASCEGAGQGYAWHQAKGDATHDRVPTARQSCAFPCEYEIAGAAATTMLPDGHGESDVCAAAYFVQDRVCRTATLCDLATEYEHAGPSTFADRDCEPLLDCGADQWETAALRTNSLVRALDDDQQCNQVMLFDPVLSCDATSCNAVFCCARGPNSAAGLQPGRGAEHRDAELPHGAALRRQLPRADAAHQVRRAAKETTMTLSIHLHFISSVGFSDPTMGSMVG